MEMTLDMLEVGGRAWIERIGSECDRAGRLATLGFIPGREVTVVRVAPLGDPVTIRVDRQEISLRRTEARLIVVREDKR